MGIVYHKDFSIVENSTDIHGVTRCTIYSGHRKPRTTANDGIEGIPQKTIRGSVEDAIEYIEQRWYSNQNYQSVLDEFG